MACFVATAVAALGVGVARHIVKHHENKFDLEVNNENVPTTYKFGSELKWSKKLALLELTLWSGSLILAGEHILHGEVVPYPPFLTAMKSPEETMEMLQEMGTVGLTMLLVLVLAWGIGIFVYDYIKYRKHLKKMEGVK